jgi:hypothetical protein
MRTDGARHDLDHADRLAGFDPAALTKILPSK